MASNNQSICCCWNSEGAQFEVHKVTANSVDIQQKMDILELNTHISIKSNTFRLIKCLLFKMPSLLQLFGLSAYS